MTAGPIHDIAQHVLPGAQLRIRFDVGSYRADRGKLQLLTGTELPVQGSGLHPKALGNRSKSETANSFS